MNSQLEKKFIQMVRDNKNDFYRVAYSYVKNEQQALDIISESIYKALNSLGKLREEKYMKTWFFRIIINESIKISRYNKNLVYSTEELYDRIECGVDQEIIIDLYNAIDKLSDKYKTVIILKYMKQMKMKEIAQLLELNINTVKVRVKRGVDSLKSIMGGNYYG